MALGKKNIVSLCPENYTHVIIGEEKSGKTTLIADIAKTYYGNIESLLCISMGKEKGHKAIQGLLYEEPQNWSEFVTVVDELIQNPDENDFKIVSIDTIDELIKIATKEVLRLSRVETGKVCKSLNQAFTGYNAGRDRLADLINEQLNRLENSKYGMFYVGHTKIKNIKQKDGEEYSQLTSNLEQAQFSLFSYNAHFICNITNEKVIDENKMLVSSKRYMNFRDNGYVKAGGRFAYFEEHYEYGAENYMGAVIEALKFARGTDMSDVTLKKEQTKELKEKESNAKAFAQSESTEVETDVIELCKAKYSDVATSVKAEVKGSFSKYGYKNFTDLRSGNNESHIKEIAKILGIEA
jgi:hypothetical protein